MKIVQKKLADLHTPEKNIRVHTQVQLKEFERSIKMFGQIRPIVIDEDGTILAGNGLYETLRTMGKDTAECIQYTGLTDNQKKKLMIADNKIFSLGVDNLETLNEWINDLSDDLDIPGFDSEVLQEMVADADAVTEQVSQYGTMPADRVQEVQNRSAPVQPDSAGFGPTAQESPQTSEDRPTNEPFPGPHTEPTAETRRSVVCPNCGEVIWL